MNSITNFSEWASWYAHWEDRQLPIAWEQHRPITTPERQAIAASIAEFQLGESSDGRRLLGAASRHAAATGNDAYAEAMLHFIREENRHSALLGRFMDQQAIPRLQHSKADGLFRRLRHAVPLALSHRVLLVAECIAVPYYRALARATTSTILNTICNQILQDEARHIAFQAQSMRMLSGQSTLRMAAHQSFSRVVLELALDVVWWNHSEVLRRGGYTFGLLRHEALEQHNWAMDMASAVIPVPSPKQLAHDSRSTQWNSYLQPSIP